MPESPANINHNQIIYGISEISQAIKRMVEDHFGYVKLRGEISGFKLASSGHAYFSLKDDKALISGVCWRGTMSKMNFKPEDGLEVVVSGKITTYPGRSNYQIVVDQMEPAGAGALMALLEKRKAELEKEGLFAAERKKSLPYLPRTIGVITSPTGAVIRDILHRIEERFPVHVLVWPVAVQGEAAAEQIAAAIKGFNSLSPCESTDSHMGRGSGLAQSPDCAVRPDLLIVARGGGSLEDLWAFNEEIVVRAAADSSIPLISAVGHETDTTLIDYVSDRRAPTPTAAAEIAVPVREELLLSVQQLGVRLTSASNQLLVRYTDRLQGLVRGLPKPEQLLQFATQKLDDWNERLRTALPVLLERKTQQLALYIGSLKPALLMREVTEYQEHVSELHERLRGAAQRQITQAEERLKHLSSLLESLNVERVLERGFVLVRGKDGQLIKNSEQAKREERLSLQFVDDILTLTTNH